ARYRAARSGGNGRRSVSARCVAHQEQPDHRIALRLFTYCKALREYARTSHATKPFAGFGNPLLDGRDANDRLRVELARAREPCLETTLPRLTRMTGRGPIIPQQRGGLVDVADIRAQEPLPETADELCSVARDLGAPDSDIWLGVRATEREVKRLSDNG